MAHQEERLLLPRPQGADVGPAQPCGVRGVHDREEVFDEERQRGVDQVRVPQRPGLYRTVPCRIVGIVPYRAVS